MNPMHLPNREDGTLRTAVFAPPYRAGGVKSLYSVCEWLKDLGPSAIIPFEQPRLAAWFRHACELYDYSYPPDVFIYPEVYQPHVEGKYNVCFALGKHAPIQPHADIVACRSVEISEWVADQLPRAHTAIILPSINRSIFEYDGRQKKPMICYMTRAEKHPETADALRARYGDKFVEIVNQTEAQVAETLREARVFVWRGSDKEGSPRPPKEALVAGCVVVGLESELTDGQHINFGIRCSDESELLHMAGQALRMDVPTKDQRSIVRDGEAEKQDWIALFRSLGVR